MKQGHDILTMDGRVFVNGRPRSEVMDDMQVRIARGDLDSERKEAIKVCAGQFHGKCVLIWAGYV